VVLTLSIKSGGQMSKQNIISQIYGYAVCLIAVIVFLFNLPEIVELVGKLSDPIHSDRAPSILAQTFEQWKINYIKEWRYGEYNEETKIKVDRPDPPDDATLQRLFDNERTQELQSYIHTTWTSFYQKGLLIVLSMIFFLSHWRWVRKFVSNVN
jgi:hypothetical protein